MSNFSSSVDALHIFDIFQSATHLNDIIRSLTGRCRTGVHEKVIQSFDSGTLDSAHIQMLQDTVPRGLEFDVPYHHQCVRMTECSLKHFWGPLDLINRCTSPAHLPLLSQTGTNSYITFRQTENDAWSESCCIAFLFRLFEAMLSRITFCCSYSCKSLSLPALRAKTFVHSSHKGAH